MSKRLTFILTSLSLTISLALTVLLSREQQVWSIFILGTAAFFFSWFALRKEFFGFEFFILLALPTLFVVGVGLTQYFFPNLSLIFKFFLWLINLIGFYVILLAQNIFCITAVKPVPLYRAARTVSFLSSLVVAIFLFTAIYKANMDVWQQVISASLLSSILGFQVLRSANLECVFDKKVIFVGFLIGLGVGEVTLGLSFLPLKSFFHSVALTTTVYIGFGLGQQYLAHSLTRRTVFEYGVTALIVGLILAAL
jgi:hypothetical protein